MRARVVKCCLLLFALTQVSVCSAFTGFKKYTPVNGEGFSLPDEGLIAFRQYPGAAAMLASGLSSVRGAWKAVEVGESSRAHIQLLPLNKDGDIPYKESDSRWAEAYRIEIGKEIKIYAGGRSGAQYAVDALVKELENNRKLDAAFMVDYPDYRWRGVIVKPANTSCRDPLPMSARKWDQWLKCMQSEVDKFAEMRLNLLGLISPVFGRMNDDDVKYLEKLFKYARQNSVEPMPIIDTKLWGVPEKELDTDAVEGIFHSRQMFRVRKGSLVAEKGNEGSSMRWAFGVPADKSWQDQSKRGDRWALAENASGGAGGVPGLAIRLDGKEDPWKNSLLLRHPETGARIKVNPAGYYELGIRVKASSGHVSVGVSQYDRQGRRIKGINRYPVKLQGQAGQPLKRWVPVFASAATDSILIRLAPGIHAGKAGRLEVSDIELRPMFSELVNVLDNEETSPVLTSVDGKTQYKNGVDYVVADSHVREWRGYSFEKLQRANITVKPESRLHDGDRVSVSYDSLPLEYRALPRSKYSAVSKYTYKAYRRLFRQFSKLPIQFLQVAFDEHSGGLNRDSRSRRLGISNRGLLIGQMNALERLLRFKGIVTTPGGDEFEGVGASSVKLVVWDDMLNPWHNGKDEMYQVGFGGLPGATGMISGKTGETQLSKSIWLSSWWYRDKDEYEIVKRTPEFYSENSYNYLVATWYQKGGIQNWLKATDPEKAQGIVATTWNGNTGGVGEVACSAWDVRSLGKCAATDHR